MNSECAVYSAYTADEKNVFGDGGVLRVYWRSVTDKDCLQGQYVCHLNDSPG